MPKTNNFFRNLGREQNREERSRLVRVTPVSRVAARISRSVYPSVSNLWTSKTIIVARTRGWIHREGRMVMMEEESTERNKTDSE